jgi:hypothetical protein
MKKINKKDFSKNDWDHMHDCILDITFKTTKKNCSREELETIFDKLPEDMQLDAYEWGMSDTLWRDNFIEYYKENMM